MALKRKDPRTRLTFDRLEHGSLSVEGCEVEGTAEDVVAVLLGLRGLWQASSSQLRLDGLPVLVPGETPPDSAVD